MEGVSVATQHYPRVIRVALATALQAKGLPSVTTMVVIMDKAVFRAQRALTTLGALLSAMPVLPEGMRTVHERTVLIARPGSLVQRMVPPVLRLAALVRPDLIPGQVRLVVPHALVESTLLLE